MSLKLNVSSNTICVGGQTLRGEAELHFPQVIEDQLEEVHVKLRGSVYTRLSRQVGNQRVVRREVRPIVAKNSSLWTRSANYPPPGSQILRVPFELTLPTDAPPSCQYDAMSRHGRIGYFVELVGVRSGLLARNRRLRVPIAVVPLDVEGEQVAARLRAHDSQLAVYASVTEKKIRRGFFGEYANTRMEISFPDTRVYPLFTAIPYTLRIITITKPVKKEEADKNISKPLFPSPPTRPTDVQFRLRRHVWLKAHWFTATGEDNVTVLGGLQTVASVSASGFPVEVQVRDREWIPSEADKNMGTWLQETTFASSFSFTCPPTFKTDTMNIKYFLSLKVDFPGVGNNLEAEIPIHICSGLSAAPPSYPADADQPPPHTLDLPPTYWGSADSWDEDEKSSS